MKKPKTLEVKLRSAIRLIWSRSSERRAILKAAIRPRLEFDDNPVSFICPICLQNWPIQMAEVDHIEPIGPLELTKITEWVDKMFHSPQRAICKLCHRKKSADDRRKINAKRKLS